MSFFSMTFCPPPAYADRIDHQGPDTELYHPALDKIKEFIKTATSSMTAVPKPLKFLRPHYESLEKAYDSWPAGENKVRCCAIVPYVHALTGVEIFCRYAFCPRNDVFRRGPARLSEVSPASSFVRSWLMGS